MANKSNAQFEWLEMFEDGRQPTHGEFSTEEQGDSWFKRIAATAGSSDDNNPDDPAISILILKSIEYSSEAEYLSDKKFEMAGVSSLSQKNPQFSFDGSRFYSQTDESGTVAKYCRIGAQLLWVHYSSTNRVVAVLELDAEIQRRTKNKIIETMWKRQIPLYYGGKQHSEMGAIIRHPFSVCVILLLTYISVAHNTINDIGKVLDDAGTKTGHSGMLAQGYGDLHSHKIDMPRLASVVCGNAVLLEVFGKLVNSCQLMLNYLIVDSADVFLGRRDQSSFEEFCRQCLTHCSNTSKAVECLSRQASFLVQGILSLVAQEDQKLNIAIAHDSRLLAQEAKKDSTSMKAIAGVTMFYLPGTFVATVYAMPLFQWDAKSGKRVISDRFYIYWALAIPLTILTLTIWLVFAWFMDRNQRKRYPQTLPVRPVHDQESSKYGFVLNVARNSDYSDRW